MSEEKKKLTIREMEDRVGLGRRWLDALAYGEPENEIKPLMGRHVCDWCGVYVPEDWEKKWEEGVKWHNADCGLARTIDDLFTVEDQLKCETDRSHKTNMAGRAIVGYIKEHPGLFRAFDKLDESEAQEFFLKVQFLARHFMWGDI